MRKNLILLLMLAACFQLNAKDPDLVEIKLESRIKGKRINLNYLKPTVKSLNQAVLIIHGASFPSALASGFKVEGTSWMNDLANAGYAVFALDFLGYGKSDRYDYMSGNMHEDVSKGRGREVALDIDIAVDYIIGLPDFEKVHLIGHSWGATVSGYYASLHPEKVDKLVLFAPFTERAGPTDWAKTTSLIKELTPAERVAQFERQVPAGQRQVLAKEIYERWGKEWLNSDPTSKSRATRTVRYPRAWELDLYDCWNGDCFFKGENIENATLIVRGEWDSAFSFKDAEGLFLQMKNARSKRYYVVDKATHVLHLEENRKALYQMVQLFLKSN